MDTTGNILRWFRFCRGSCWAGQVKNDAKATYGHVGTILFHTDKRAQSLGLKFDPLNPKPETLNLAQAEKKRVRRQSCTHLCKGTLGSLATGGASILLILKKKHDPSTL